MAASLDQQQRQLLESLVRAWNKTQPESRVPFKYQSVPGANRSSLEVRHPGLPGNISVPYFDLDKLINSGYLEIVKPNIVGGLPEIFTVSFVVTNEGQEYSKRINSPRGTRLLHQEREFLVALVQASSRDAEGKRRPFTFERPGMHVVTLEHEHLAEGRISIAWTFLYHVRDLGYVEIMTRPGSPPRGAVHITAEGWDFAQDLLRRSSATSPPLVNSDSVAQETDADDSNVSEEGTNQVTTHIFYDLSKEEEDLLIALYRAWENVPPEEQQDFIFPPWDLTVPMLSHPGLPSGNLKVPLAQLRFLDENGLIRLTLPPPATKRGSAPGGAISVTSAGRRCYRVLTQKSDTASTSADPTNMGVSPRTLTLSEDDLRQASVDQVMQFLQERFDQWESPKLESIAKNADITSIPRRPRVFIGSSLEGIRIAEAIQANMARDSECVLWNQGVFGLGRSPVQALASAVQKFDFAVLVLTPDDQSVRRGVSGASPRDNILFEIGLFMGATGFDRTFMVVQSGVDLQLPSDLAGVTQGRYHLHPGENAQAALGPFCTELKAIIRERGPKDEKN